MIAGIDADNAVSIALHLKLGFRNVGHFHQVGFKFGRWLDLVFLQCSIPATAAAAAAPVAPNAAQSVVPKP